MDTLLPPQNLDAERAVLGAVLIAPKAFAEVRAILSDDDWYRPQHETIWRAMVALEARGEAIDALTVAAELTNSEGSLNRIGGHGYLVDLVGGCITAANVTYHAAMVAEAACRRRVIEGMTRCVQRAYEGADIDALLADCQSEVDTASGLLERETSGLYAWHEFFGKFGGRPEQWVVPGLIGRKDIWLILAPPGAGKTMLSRQLAQWAAAGMHPFDEGTEIDPPRTLHVDLENDEDMAADESLDFFARLDATSQGTADRGHIWARPQGLDLTKPADVALLDRVMTETRPDLMTLGSLNNAYSRRGDWDQVAYQVRDALNRLRVKHQCALWIEHHMPKASDGGRRRTPFGSSLFESWPSHGRVLERTSNSQLAPFRFEAAFRGDRGRKGRRIPVGFLWGTERPWIPIYDQAELDHLAGQAVEDL